VKFAAGLESTANTARGLYVALRAGIEVLWKQKGHGWSVLSLSIHPCRLRYSRSGTSTSLVVDTHLVLSWMTISARRPCTDRSFEEPSVFGLFVRYLLWSAMVMPFSSPLSFDGPHSGWW